ncbi:MAG: AmmeMemoRadiSam system protein B [Acidobacteriia bacterium]|nr:AmmeMemoRadiSam system protein B [Terriglobia bacterium]
MKALKLISYTVISLIFLAALAPDAPTVRPPAVAGSFYPADPKALTAMVDGFLARVDQPATAEPILAMVAPHAGYPFSGPVAAYSYAQLKGRKISRVVVIAPSHYESFPFVAAYDGDAYRTPLGEIPVDKQFVKELAKATPVVQISSRGHAPAAHGGEHALEVELPFLQRVLGEFTLVPLVMGDQSFDQDRSLGLALAKLIHGPETLIVASSDLSHYHPQQDAAQMDRKMLKALEEWDYRALSRNIDARVWEACGGGPIIAAMIAAEKLGANHAQVLKYATSGDTSGDKGRVVGYAAIAFTRAAHAGTAEKFSLTAQERAELLNIARQAVRAAVLERKRYEPPTPKSDALLQERGAFVTLKRRGELRGCIGATVAQKPLYVTVRDVAVYAALQDPRFPPVSAAEFNDLEFEVSVISPFRRVLDVREVRVGEHGLLVRRGRNEGLLLPQVPIEQKWDRHTFLEKCCHKAGLDADAWKDSGTDIFVFTALVFSDADQQRRER